MENTTTTKTNRRRPRLTEIFEEHMAHLAEVERRINASFDDLSRFMGIEPKTETEVSDA